MKFLLSLVVLFGAALPALAYDKPQSPAKLSVSIEDSASAATTPVPLAENKALSDELDLSFASKGLSQFKTAFADQPALWTIIVSVLGIFGVRSGARGISGLLAKCAETTSPGEVTGIVLLSIGGLAIANAAALGFGWSHLTANLLMGGILAGFYGVGIACEANETRKKGSKT